MAGQWKFAVWMAKTISFGESAESTWGYSTPWIILGKFLKLSVSVSKARG